MLEKFALYITQGTRPFRILFFGGVFLALIIMNILAMLLNIETSLGGDINLPNIILIIVSLFLGFGISYSVLHVATNIKNRKDLSE